MNTILFSLASNINQEENINEAITKIKSLQNDSLIFSPVKMYKPINFKYQSEDFANCVGIMKSNISLNKIIDEMHKIESSLGRNQIFRKENPDKVIIDIDIVVFNDIVIRRKDYEQEYFQDGLKYINYKV